MAVRAEIRLPETDFQIVKPQPSRQATATERFWLLYYGRPAKWTGAEIRRGLLSCRSTRTLRTLCFFWRLASSRWSTCKLCIAQFSPSSPSFGGMTIAIITMLVVPVLYCSAMEWKLKLGIDDPRFAENA